MPRIDEYRALLTKNGISLLVPMGIEDVALNRGDALRAIEILRGSGYPILGGDVYFRREEKIESAHANWYTKYHLHEDSDAYCNRSYDEAVKYIEGFNYLVNVEILFSLVVRNV